MSEDGLSLHSLSISGGQNGKTVEDNVNVVSCTHFIVKARGLKTFLNVGDGDFFNRLHLSTTPILLLFEVPHSFSWL